MLTAIILTASLVFAVIIYSIFKTSSECSRVEEQDWARKWNEQRAKESYKYCDDICLHCEENDNCKFSEVKL